MLHVREYINVLCDINAFSPGQFQGIFCRSRATHYVMLFLNTTYDFIVSFLNVLTIDTL